MGKPQSDDHILIDGQRHSSVFDIQPFRAVDCDMVDINSTWETIRGNINIIMNLKKHEP
jgi:hypothetical protein